MDLPITIFFILALVSIGLSVKTQYDLRRAQSMQRELEAELQALQTLEAQVSLEEQELITELQEWVDSRQAHG
jgi:hypothetical protein